MSVLNLDVNITNISNLFANRLDLINIPFINLDNITNMENTFINCNNLSEASYGVIANMLPLASNLTNLYIENIGLTVTNFSGGQLAILNSKGYLDAIAPLPYYNIYYNTL